MRKYDQARMSKHTICIIMLHRWGLTLLPCTLVIQHRAKGATPIFLVVTVHKRTIRGVGSTSTISRAHLQIPFSIHMHIRNTFNTAPNPTNLDAHLSGTRKVYDTGNRMQSKPPAITRRVEFRWHRFIFRRGSIEPTVRKLEGSCEETKCWG